MIFLMIFNNFNISLLKVKKSKIFYFNIFLKNIVVLTILWRIRAA
jgi:hypothetical protein